LTSIEVIVLQQHLKMNLVNYFYTKYEIACINKLDMEYVNEFKTNSSILEKQ